MKHLLLGTVLTSTFSLMSAIGAQAQNTDDQVLQLDTVIVTAQRREQSAQDVGIALSTFSGDELIRKGVSGINALENIAPNLEMESQFGAAATSFSIRGVGFRDYATLNAPTVGVYVDDVGFAVPIMTQGVLFDVARVEVLRGPQGTLYGRNTTGGAIKILSSRPTKDTETGLTAEYGRFNRLQAEGFVSGALGPHVRGRISGITTQGGAWQVNRETGAKLGDADKFAARLQVEADLSPNITALFNLHGYTDQSDGLGLQLFNNSVFGPLAHARRRETSFGSSAAFAGLVGITPTTKPFRDFDGWGTSLTLNANLGSADLTYIGSFETLSRREFADYDALAAGAAGVFFDSSIKDITQEVRLVSNTDSALQWVTGVFYADQDLDEVYQSDFVASFGPGFAVTTPYNQNVETIGIYGQFDYQISEKFSFSGGLRFEDEDRQLRNLGTFALVTGPLNFANGTVDGTRENRDQSLSEVTGKAQIDYKPSDETLLYASISRGIKSGGFTAYNTLNPRAVDPFTFEELLAYETGFKSEFADGRVRLNGAAFYYDYRDQQVQSAIFDTNFNAVVGRIINAPKSKIYGGELELTWQAAPGLQITQTVGFKDGEFKKFDDLDVAASIAAGATVTTDRSGQSLGIPHISYQGGLSYTGAIGHGKYWRGSADYSYRDTVTPPLLGPIYTVDDYWLVNAELAVGSDDGTWEISLWGRNIFDKRYDETRNFFIAPGAVADVSAPGLPATFGLRLRLHN